MITFAPFGGCGLNNPLNHLRRLGVGEFVFRQMGFQATPFALSATANLQLLDFVTGKLEIPQWIRRLMYGDVSHQPTKEQGDKIFACDFVISEMSTPVDYMFEGFVLNINRFEEVMAEELAQLQEHRKLIGTWRQALVKGKDDVRAAAAEEIYGLLRKDSEEQQNLARFVRETTSRILSQDEIAKAAGELRERIGKPMGLVLHNFQFLPDGRAISWPADFKRQMAEVGERLDMPTFDLAPYVQEHGVGRVMAADRRHWEPSYIPRLSEQFYDFAASVLGRPPIKDELARLREEKMASEDDMEDEIEEGAPDSAQRAGQLARYEFDYESGGYLPQIDDTVFVVLLLGQSWASGATADATDLVPVTIGSEHKDHALMFDAGIRPGGRAVEKFIDLHESVLGTTRETPCSGIADHIMRHCDARFADKPTILFISAASASTLTGAGMTPESGSMRGSQQHRQLLRYVNRARQIAGESGKRVEVLGICFAGGDLEAGQKSSSAALFERQISLLQQQYDSDLRAITGQVQPVRLFVSQTGRSTGGTDVSPVVVAQLAAQDRNMFVRCAGPTYCFPTEIREKGHPLHAKPLGHRRLGQTFGHFLLQDCWGTGADAMRVTDGYWLNPVTARLRFSQPVAIETSDHQVRVSDLGPGAGINFDDGSAWSPSVREVRTIKGRDYELEIELSGPSSGPHKRFLIAVVPTVRGASGNLQGARSAIRSRRPFDKDPLDGTDLYQWACAQEFNVP